MQTRSILFVAAVVLVDVGCKEVDCGDGTVERNGTCEPADEVITPATCGAFTELQGTQCVPMFPPTVCDSTTTMADVDPETGVTTCIGTGGGGCSAPFACPAPAAGKQTICGQLYDLETNQPYAAIGASGAQCDSTPAADGPCALGIRAFDAIEFGTNPQTAMPRTTGPVYIDDCGRYRVPDIEVPSGPFIGLGIDDAVMANQGPLGVTNTVGIATGKAAGMATRDVEGWIVKPSTTAKWSASGGTPLSGGYYVAVFRAMSTGTALASGVAMTRSGAMIPDQDQYFVATETTRETVDPDAMVTGANGTALITGASVAQNVVYSGTGALPAGCEWSTHAGATLPYIVFVQLLRPKNILGQQCPL